MVILLIQAGIIIFNNFILEEEISLIYISSGILQKSDDLNIIALSKY